jgi:hypothetical protein
MKIENKCLYETVQENDKEVGELKDFIRIKLKDRSNGLTKSHTPTKYSRLIREDSIPSSPKKYQVGNVLSAQKNKQPSTVGSL